MSKTLAALALCVTAVSSLVLPSAAAHGPTERSPWRAPVATPAVRVMIDAPEGGAFSTVEHRGSTFVAGELGERYAVRLINDGPERLEVVVTVDGRDVLSGRIGDFKRQRGYVLDPFSEVVVDGFRQSLDHVAAFRFSAVRDSYTARRGTAQHAGVIGVAVFRERAPVHRHHHPMAATESAPSKKSSSTTRPHDDARRSNRDEEKLGTEFGETLVSQVIEVPFMRRNATRPDEFHRVTYDSAQRLRARGVPIDPVFEPEPWSADPSPWPAARHDDRFAPAPPPRRSWR